MRRLTAAALALTALPLFAACNDGPEVDRYETRMDSCMDKGGAYFESEDTSAGRHIWCIQPDGAEIKIDGSE